MTYDVRGAESFYELLGVPKMRGPDVSTDSARRSDERESGLKGQAWRSHVNDRAYLGEPMNQSRRHENRCKSRVLTRMEHNLLPLMRVGGMAGRTIGIEQVRVRTMLKLSSYNLKHLEIIIRVRTTTIDRMGVRV